MLTIRGFAALAAALCAFAVPAAAADTCETETLPQAIMALQKQVTADDVVARMDLMDSLVAACPEHGWINVLGAELDRTTYRALLQASNGSPDQQALNYLLRGFERSNVFQQGPDENRKERYGIWLGPNEARLVYSVATDNRKGIIEELMTLARQGKVHPYLAAELPMVCSGWITGDAMTVAYAVKSKADRVLLPFIDAAAKACSVTDGGRGQLPVALKAVAYARFVRDGELTDRDEISGLLTEAKAAQDAYVTGRGFDFFYSESEAERLTKLMQQHAVRTGDEPVLLARELWFTPEHVRSPEAVYSIALALSGTWTPLAAGTEAGDTQTVATARTKLSSLVFALLKEGADAGLKPETQVTLREALTAFQTGKVRTMHAANLPGALAFLYDMLIKILTPAEAGDAEAGE